MKTDSAIARLKRLLHAAAMRLTGGRPMTRVESLFVDRVTGDLVSEYRDQFGRHWMATGPWDAFRARRPENECERPWTTEQLLSAIEMARDGTAVLNRARPVIMREIKRAHRDELRRVSGWRRRPRMLRGIDRYRMPGRLPGVVIEVVGQ